jgi:hypothetical protein
VTVKISEGLDMLVEYDSRCGYTALHGSLYAWLAPADQDWFDRIILEEEAKEKKEEEGGGRREEGGALNRGSGERREGNQREGSVMHQQNVKVGGGGGRAMSMGKKNIQVRGGNNRKHVGRGRRMKKRG